MTISLRSDSGGTSGAVQINGTDVLTVAGDGTLTTTASPAAGDNTNKLATTAFVRNAISANSGRLVNIQYLLAGTTTYTRSPGATWGFVEIGGGGGGSGGVPATNASQVAISAEGRCGHYVFARVAALPATCPVIVGAGGSAGTSTTGGGDGGTSEFGSSGSTYFLYAYGGYGSTYAPLQSTFPAVGGLVVSIPWSSIGFGSDVLYLNVFADESSDFFVYPYIGAFTAGIGYTFQTNITINAKTPFGPNFCAGGAGKINNPSAVSAFPGKAGKNGQIIVYEYAAT